MSDTSQPGSVTRWIAELKAGNRDAAEQLWERFFRRVMSLAGRLLPSHRKRISDEEDVAVSVFVTLCAGAAEGRFVQLTDRDDLWRLLFRITAHKSAGVIRRETRKKRGSGQVRGDSAVAAGVEQQEPAGFNLFAGDEPTPDMLVQAEEECERLLNQLGSDSLRQVAVLRLRGESNAEIAEAMNLSVKGIERKLRACLRIVGYLNSRRRSMR